MPLEDITTGTESPTRKSKPYSHPDRHWEVRDAMHTIMRAHEHSKDKKLMSEVKKHAAEHAEKMRGVSQQAEHLAKSGHISAKQMAKMGKR